MLPKNYSLKKLFVIFSFFEIFCTRVGNSERFSQGFIHSESDVKYFGEEVPGVSQSFSEDQTFSYQDDEGTITVLGSPIKFDPPNLNFKEKPIGVPGLHKVTIHNINSHSSIQMLSISGNTIHFHCSFFEDKVIPPGGNTTFDVVFLGREPGIVENTLYIHTSAGSFRYNVRGTGTPNPYRIKPLVGVRLPVNSSYNPVIQIHNPHPATIQVLEMYSSGGDLHLELPGGGHEAETGIWQIPPYHTKEVMKANFLARAESNHTAYIRIKTNTTGAEFLYLPLEVEVSSQPGIYCPQEMVDFGLVPSDSGIKTMELLVLNSGSKPITVSNVVATPVSESLNIDFSSTRVDPNTLSPSVIASVSFDPNIANQDGKQEGKLLIKSSNSKYKVTIPWQAEVLKGGLHWNETVSKFLMADQPDLEDESQAALTSASRPLTITNKFAVPVVVYSVKVAEEARSLFDIGPFKPTVIKAGQSVELLNVSVKKDAWTGEKMVDSFLTLETNLTSVKVPLLAFDGKLKSFFPAAPGESILDFGTIGMNEKRDLYFALINKGPVKVVLRGWGGNITGSLIELMGVSVGNETTIAAKQNFSDLAKKLFVMPGHYVVYRIGLQSGTEEGEFHASVFVSTEFEELRVPFRFRVAKGSLSMQNQDVSFEPTFPGKVSELKLHVHSSFKHKMKVKSLSVVGDDPRFSFDLSGAEDIRPGSRSFVGSVMFDPGAECDQEEAGGCYTGFSPDSKFGRPWYLGLAMPLNLGEMDLAVVHNLWSKMKAASNQNAIFNVTLKLDTSEVRGFLFSARASLSWPMLSSSREIKFPLTQLGNFTQRSILVTNPSSKPLLVHIVPMTAYPDALSVINLLPTYSQFQRSSPNALGSETAFDAADAKMFHIDSVVDAEEPDEQLESFGGDFSEKFGVEVSSATFPVILKAGQTVKVSVSFTPEEPAGSHSSVLFIRNNLTGVDIVDLSGAGAVGDIKFGNRRPGSVIHAFEVTEKHLKDCEKASTSKQQSMLPNLTVKRPFTARNSGDVSIWVTGFEIDGKLCEGYGFKVLDCDPFLLAANDSKKINIAFTPDFTLSRVTRTLTLKTSLGSSLGQGDVKYFLAATVPPHLLALCSKALPRPYWEKIIYYGTLALLCAGFCCVMIAAFFEADRILKFCFLMASPNQQNFMAENCKPFDLKEIARNATLESERRIEAIEAELNQGKSIYKRKDETGGDTLPNPSYMQELLVAKKEVSIHQPSKFGMIKKVFSTLRNLLRTVFISQTQNAPQPTPTSQPIDTTESKEESPKSQARKELVTHPSPLPKKSPDSRKTKNGNKKNGNKSKIITQNTVNDEVETSSTTTESSNAEELTETFVTKGITNGNLNVSANSVATESAKKKKKPQKVKSEEVSKETSNAIKISKKKVDKQEIKPEQRQEKVKAAPRTASEPNKSPPPKADSPPPQPKMKQEAKVKGFPKEVSELRRQQSAPAYDRPPRLQGQGRSEAVAGTHGQADNNQTTPTVQKPEPPRAIILPEMKQNPGSQFGPIGCKVPNTGLTSKSTWNDSPAAPAPVPARLLSSPATGPPPPPTLLPPPGLTIMQQLQAERRQREEEYVRRQNNWPGFSDRNNARETQSIAAATSYVENLWDAPAQPPQAQAGLWGSLDNVWPSTVFNSGFNEGRNIGRDTEPGSLGYDSLSLSSIWASASGRSMQPQEADQGQGVGAGDTWSSLFNENKKDI